MAAQVDGTEVAAVVIQGRGVWRARTHDRASFYPCGTRVSGTTSAASTATSLGRSSLGSMPDSANSWTIRLIGPIEVQPALRGVARLLSPPITPSACP